MIDFPLAEARSAVERSLPPSPLLPHPGLSECIGLPVHLKLENLQVTGSFKVRGALARISALGPRERGRGVVACSSGNHGRAVAWVARRLRIPAIICVPSWVDPLKLRAMRAAGAEVRQVGDSYDEAEAEALRIAGDEGRSFVSPFDDPWVVAGQATVGSEILDQLGEAPAEVLVPLSGGGLAGGIAVALEAAGHPGRVTAVSAVQASVMLQSVRAGRPLQLDEEETLASALAGGIGEPNRVTFELVRDRIDRHLEVTEAAIADAVRRFFSHHGMVVEGGGAVAFAGLLERAAGRIEGPTPPEAGPTVVVVSGGNLDPRSLAGLVGGP